MFVFSLARELGMTVQQMLANITSREIVEWQAFFSAERKEMEKKKTGKKSQSPEELTAILKAQFATRKS